MLQNDLATHPGPVKIPDCSADWRFLLPIRGGRSVLVVAHDCDEFVQSLDAINVKSTRWHFGNFTARVHRPESEQTHFDAVAFPVGIPRDITITDPEQLSRLLEDALHLLTPGGALLFGFANRMGLSARRSGARPIQSTRDEMKHLLITAGYSAVEIYGTFPNLEVPEFIFSPIAEDLQFVLRRRYKHKLPSFILNLVTLPALTSLLLRAIPFYYAVAYRSSTSAH